MQHLTGVTVRGIAGLADVEVGLQPMTAVIGARASGKSRLLAAISWLLSGRPALDSPAAGASPEISGRLVTTHGTRTISRSRRSTPLPPLPRCRFLPARSRLVAQRARRGDSRSSWSDAAKAEAMVAEIEADCRAGRHGEVLIIEEPELLLTPQTQRYLYRLLRTFAEENQVIYSTRSPALLDAIHHEEILRLDLAEAGLRVRQAPAALLTDEERLRLAAEFDHERSEMFFARAVVLVEGQTERLSLPPIFRSLGHDADALGISIVEVGGKGNLPLAARLLAELAVPHLVVFDADTGAPGEEENAAIRQAVAGAPIVRLDPDFEAVAGISSHDEKVLHAWRRFHDVPAERIPAPFRQIVEVAVMLARSGS
jgi:predicted ATPase